MLIVFTVLSLLCDSTENCVFILIGVNDQRQHFFFFCLLNVIREVCKIEYSKNTEVQTVISDQTR